MTGGRTTPFAGAVGLLASGLIATGVVVGRLTDAWPGAILLAAAFAMATISMSALAALRASGRWLAGGLGLACVVVALGVGGYAYGARDTVFPETRERDPICNSGKLVSAAIFEGCENDTLYVGGNRAPADTGLVLVLLGALIGFGGAVPLLRHNGTDVARIDESRRRTLSILQTADVGGRSDRADQDGPDLEDLDPPTLPSYLMFGAPEPARPIKAHYVFCGKAMKQAAIPARVKGNIALVQRGSGTFEEKAVHAASSGAVAVILINDGDLDDLLDVSAEGAPLPMFGVGETDGAALFAALRVGEPAFDPSEPSTWNTTSRCLLEVEP